MNDTARIKALLRQAANKPSDKTLFYKTAPGSYAEHDQFIGVSVPILRSIANDFPDIALDELIASKINEERLLALIILVAQYRRADAQKKEERYQFYLSNLQYVNNWNLVDASAHLIIGAHLLDKNRNLLLELAGSNIMWERRIAIVATWAFIKQHDLGWTFKLATLLLGDSHDLIHKAVGWMLREAGKRDQDQFISFLDHHHTIMPRVMLRYAIEKLPEHHRQNYLLTSKRYAI